MMVRIGDCIGSFCRFSWMGFILSHDDICVQVHHLASHNNIFPASQYHNLMRFALKNDGWFHSMSASAKKGRHMTNGRNLLWAMMIAYFD